LGQCYGQQGAVALLFSGKELVEIAQSKEINLENYQV
jgi:hypothetical protein